MTTTEPQPSRRSAPRVALLATCLAAAVVGYLVTPGRAPDGSIGSVSTPQGSATAEHTESQAGPVEMSARSESESWSNAAAQRWNNAAWWKQLPASASTLGFPHGADCPYIEKWLRAHSGVDRGWSSVTLSIRARRPTHITVVTMRAHILSARPAIPAPTLLCIPNTEPYLDSEPNEPLVKGVRAFMIDGSENTIYTYQASDENGESGQDDVGFGEILHLPVTAYAHACDCTWKLEVEALVDGNRQRWLLDNEDQHAPFRTIAPPSSPTDPTIEVWCAPDGHGRLTVPDRGDCPLPDE